MTEPTSSPVPPPSPPPPPSRWPDVLLAVVVLGFAFLASSFAARNSDLFLHLAAGRLLAQGRYVFGTDPFSYTTQNVYWANHSWLSDLATYAGFQSLGGRGLVVIKALLVAITAGLMLLLARPRSHEKGPFWVTAGLVLLAVLAMTPRLLLQPACLSLPLLAMCLGLLRAGGRAFLAVPVLVALWVNLDSWFVLGPLVVALYGLGQLLGPREGRLPWWLLPACLVACLLSPHHVYGLALPSELSPEVWLGELRRDGRFASLFAMPWRLDSLGVAGGVSLSAWAFVLLFGLSFLSFAFNRAALRSWRLPVWLGFALLAAWQARLVPFFAVVAGPIAALNIGELLPARTLLRPGRFVVTLAGVALAALTWPGWLHGFQRHERPLAWAVEPDPTLRRVAETLRGWRDQGLLPSGVRTFATHPDVAHYCAWYFPEETGFFDSRLPLFGAVTHDYERLCRALGAAGGDASAALTWEQVLRDQNIGCVVIYDPDFRGLASALDRVAEDPERWDLLRVDGNAVIVAWKGTRGSLPSFDADRLAYSPANADPASPLPPAPDRGPSTLARPSAWWNAYLQRPSGSSWETGAGAVYLRLFEEEAPRTVPGQRRRVFSRQVAGLVGLSALAEGIIPTLVTVGPGLILDEVYLPDMSERPAALPLLSVRAARRAVAEHPDDPAAWLVLGRAYLTLSRTTAESVGDGLPPLAEVRAIQTVAALTQAVTLDPDMAAAHETLAMLYAERQYLDLALRHRQTQLDLVRRSGRPAGEDQDTFAARLAQLERAVEQMRESVQTSESRYAVHSETLTSDPLARAKLALDLGLAARALDDVLLKSHSDLYGIEGLRLILDLLLHTGRVQDAGVLLGRDEMRANPDALGLYELRGGRRTQRRWNYRLPAFDWCELCQAAAAGDYDRCSAALGRMRDRLRREADKVKHRLTPDLAARVASEVGLQTLPSAVLPRMYDRLERDQVAGWLAQSEFVPVERADLHALEGMLRLEQGRTAEAKDQFRLATALYDDVPDTIPARLGLPLTRDYLDRVRQFAP